MNRQRIIEILETYRPGEGLEADPEVREALELSAEDPELSKIREDISGFDAVFGEKLRSIEVPSTLYEDILKAAADHRKAAPAQPEKSPRNVAVFNWFHPAAFAAAAAIVLLLALSFTFWNRPDSTQDPNFTMAAGISPVQDIAKYLYNNKNPSFRSSEKQEILQFVRSEGGMVPANMPEGFAWDRAFACDVVDVDGVKVSMICFLGPDRKSAMHLFTFRRADFPEFECPGYPTIQNEKDACRATWMNGDEILILFSDGGEENLRTILDI